MAIGDNLTSGAIIASSTIGLPAMDGAWFLMFLAAIWLIFQLVIAAGKVKELFFPSANPPATEKYRHADECEKRCNANLAQHDRLEHEFNERMTAMSGHSANSRKAMYERLTRVESELAGIKKENELQTKELYLIRDMLARQNSQKQ